ncbi:MAG TPA: DUF3455 domain-containing protein, partial [Micromonosporaceae bacterium]|nr:DUF3455 domain-containing protein [Micromonosporaceae bacterium]
GVTGVAVAGLLATAAIVSPGASAADTAAPVATTADVPPEIQVPAGNVLSSVFAAKGVQHYTCSAGAWTLLEPAATLIGLSRNPRGAQAAIHYAGPSWQSTIDGSAIQATRRAGVPNPGSIDLLLLEARNPRGNGVFSRVTFIQRLKTTGGVAPTGSCTDGQTKASGYGAEYRFFVAG